MEKSTPQTLINGNLNIQNLDTGKTHRTSIRLEKVEWDALRRICAKNKMSIHAICSHMDQSSNRYEHSRTSRIRCAVLQYYFNRVIEYELREEKKQQQGQSQKREQSGDQNSARNLTGRTTIA
ncbi:MAG: ribbon-helix-helix domain-containing protein [Sneathiella sp.]|nr:ribbon-helix-helix domain-containing protein [Sneathiella sp.]